MNVHILATTALYWYLRAKGQDRCVIDTAANVLGCSVAEVGRLELDDRLRVTDKDVRLTTKNKGEINEVFRYWIEKTGRTGRTKLTGGRKSKIKARLREGYTTENLCSAVDGCLASPWHRGENPDGTVYDTLVLICRSGEDVERFIEYAGKGRKGKTKSTTSFSTVTDAEEEINTALYVDDDLVKTIAALRRASPTTVAKWAQAVADKFGVSRAYIERQAS